MFSAWQARFPRWILTFNSLGVMAPTLHTSQQFQSLCGAVRCNGRTWAAFLLGCYLPLGDGPSQTVSVWRQLQFSGLFQFQSVVRWRRRSRWCEEPERVDEVSVDPSGGGRAALYRPALPHAPGRKSHILNLVWLRGLV